MLGLILTAAIAAVTAIVVTRTAEPDTVRTVRAFLTAVRDKDPARAFAAAGVTTPPSGDAARFLAADAMSDEWEIRSLEQNYELTDTAQVRVTITGPDGRTATATMGLTRQGDGWRIDEPFLRARIDSGPLWYADVNGVRTSTGMHPPDLDYPLFPGFYRFYAEPPAGVEAHYPELLALPDTYAVSTVVAPDVLALTATGEQLVQRTVETYVDACTQHDEPAPNGCPFGTDPVTGPRLPDRYLPDIEGFGWSVVAYPVVAAVPSRTGLAITDRQRGVVELRATGDAGDFTLECEMITSRLVAGIAADGTVTVLPAEAQLGGQDSYTWDTCDHPLRVSADG